MNTSQLTYLKYKPKSVMTYNQPTWTSNFADVLAGANKRISITMWEQNWIASHIVGKTWKVFILNQYVLPILSGQVVQTTGSLLDTNSVTITASKLIQDMQIK